MEWAYIAGYFDGEGHVSLHQGKRRQLVAGLFWANTHRESLETMMRFIDAGHISTKDRSEWGRKTCYSFAVTRRADMLRVLEKMIPYLLIKRSAAEQLRDHLLTNRKDQAANFGHAEAVSTEQYTRWYHDEGKSLAQIGKKIGVSVSAISQVFTRRGISARPAGGSHFKGTRKSKVTKQKMRDAQQIRRAAERANTITQPG